MDHHFPYQQVFVERNNGPKPLEKVVEINLVLFLFSINRENDQRSPMTSILIKLKKNTWSFHVCFQLPHAIANMLREKIYW